jgi:hypothetical protein
VTVGVNVGVGEFVAVGVGELVGNRVGVAVGAINAVPQPVTVSVRNTNIDTIKTFFIEALLYNFLLE